MGSYTPAHLRAHASHTHERTHTLLQSPRASKTPRCAAPRACRVEVGGGRLPDALRQLLRVPSLWAALAGLLLSAAGCGLPTALDAVTACLAPVHRPLMMLAAGLTLRFELPPPGLVSARWATCSAAAPVRGSACSCEVYGRCARVCALGLGCCCWVT